MSNSHTPTAIALAGLAACASAAGAPLYIHLELPSDDVWAYVSAFEPTSTLVLSAWGSNGVDLNPEGFPGPQPGRNFWSHAFLAWNLPPLPHNFGWGGATLTVTLASDTWQKGPGNTFVRFLNHGLHEATWNIFSNTPIPVAALGEVLGDDSEASGADTTIIYTIPADLDPAIWRKWINDGQIYLAITADTAPPPPPMPGQPPDLTGTLQIYSREDIFGRGPILTLTNVPRRTGDIDGDGVVNSSDLALILGNWGGNDFFADINGDGIVNSTDLGLLLGSWGG